MRAAGEPSAATILPMPFAEQTKVMMLQRLASGGLLQQMADITRAAAIKGAPQAGHLFIGDRDLASLAHATGLLDQLLPNHVAGPLPP